MEKLRDIRGPPGLQGYYSLGGIDMTEFRIVNGAGGGFCFGTAGGFCYNFLRGSGGKFNRRLAAALNKSPQIGGICALLTLYADVTGMAIYKHVGDRMKANQWYDIPCNGVAGALVFAPRGLRVACLAAFANAACGIIFAGINIHDTRDFSKLVNNNP